MENSSAGKTRRKTFAAREDLMEEMNEIAEEKGLSLYGFINEAFEATLKAEKQGMNLQSLVDGIKSLRTSRETGFILGLESLWYEMAELAYSKAKDEALKNWFDAGVWLAKSYVSNGVEEPLYAFKKQLEAFVWYATELEIKRVDDRVTIRVISPRFPESYTYLFAAFLEGAMGAFGYKNTNSDVSRGTIRLRAKWEGDKVGETR